MDWNERMDLGKKLMPIIITIIVGGLMLGYAVGNWIPLENKVVKDSNVCVFDGADKNFMIQLAYQQGSCERLGLQTTVIQQKYLDTNIVYGVPVCVEQQVVK